MPRFSVVQVLFFSFVFIASCCGQNLPDDQYPTIEHSTPTDSSLQIDDYVVEVFEDSKGNLWFGTLSKGTARYDGETLSYFSTTDGLCDNTVVSIAEDKAGNLWFGTHNGVSKYDGETFSTPGGAHGPGCKILVDHEGCIWAGTNHGVFRFTDSTFSEFEIPNPIVENLSYKWEAGKIWGLMEDKKGNIWFGRDGYGACKFDGTSFTHFTKKDGLCSNNVTSIVEDDKGNIWFGCLSSDFPEYIDEGGLSRYDGKNFTKFQDVEGLGENDIYTIYKEKSGAIWIGAVGIGAYRYDAEKFTLFSDTNRPDLTINFGVQAILEDNNGTLWFGFSGGLFRFNGISFVNVTQDGPWK